MSKIELTKQGTLLIAESMDARDTLERIKNGQYVIAEIRVPRSIRQHRLYWGMLSLVFKNQNEPVLFGNIEHIHNAIKIALGYYQTLYDIEGKPIGIMPDKTDFTSMDRIAFSEMMEKSIELIVTKIIPNTKRVDLERQFYNMLGERNYV